MYVTLLTAVLLTQAPQAGTQPPARDAQPAAAQSMDGTWTVVCLEKDGQPVPDAKNLTVTVKNGVCTFAGGDEKNRQKAMRVEFGPNGTARVTEQDAAAAPGEPARADAAAGDPKAAKTGHYILTKDFFCVCLKDGRADVRPAGGERPAGAADDQPVRRAGGADAPRGAFSTSIPHGKPDSCVVILKRADGGSTGDRRP
jgi:hypothetical protein